MKHLYNSGLLGKTCWFIKRFGWQELWRKPLRTFFGIVTMPIYPILYRFTYRGQELMPVFSITNCTWAGERCIELAMANYEVMRHQPDKVLEVGNVLSHYQTVRHLVIDKYEQGLGVVNMDIVDVETSLRYDLIISVSTFEHIGFDAPSNNTIRGTINKVTKLLTHGGRLVLTLPIGYNPEVDDMLLNVPWINFRVWYYHRVGFSQWEACNIYQAFAKPYRSKYPYANAIAVLEITK